MNRLHPLHHAYLHRGRVDVGRSGHESRAPATGYNRMSLDRRRCLPSTTATAEGTDTKVQKTVHHMSVEVARAQASTQPRAFRVPEFILGVYVKVARKACQQGAIIAHSRSREPVIGAAAEPQGTRGGHKATCQDSGSTHKSEHACMQWQTVGAGRNSACGSRSRSRGRRQLGVQECGRFRCRFRCLPNGGYMQGAHPHDAPTAVSLATPIWLRHPHPSIH